MDKLIIKNILFKLVVIDIETKFEEVELETLDKILNNELEFDNIKFPLLTNNMKNIILKIDKINFFIKNIMNNYLAIL